MRMFYDTLSSHVTTDSFLFFLFIFIFLLWYFFSSLILNEIISVSACAMHGFEQNLHRYTHDTKIWKTFIRFRIYAFLCDSFHSGYTYHSMPNTYRSNYQTKHEPSSVVQLCENVLGNCTGAMCILCACCSNTYSIENDECSW